MIPFKFLTNECVIEEYGLITWRTGNGSIFYIRDLNTSHIRNILCCLYGRGMMTIPDPYWGRSHREWKSIFEHVLINLRNETI